MVRGMVTMINCTVTMVTMMSCTVTMVISGSLPTPIRLPNNHFLCPVCNKHLTSFSDCKRHIENVHFGIKPFQCGVCKMNFSTRSNLKRHDLKLHQNKATPPTAAIPGGKTYMDSLKCI